MNRQFGVVSVTVHEQNHVRYTARLLIWIAGRGLRIICHLDIVNQPA